MPVGVRATGHCRRVADRSRPHCDAGEGTVVITADDATPMTTGSSPQAELTAASLASPL